MHVETSGESAESSEEDKPRCNLENLRWKKKYMLLLKRTENVEKQNMRLVNRIYQIKSITKRLKTEKRFLVRRLDRHRDNFRGSKIFTDVELLPEGICDASNRTLKHSNGDGEGEEEEMPNEKALLGLPPKKPMSAFFRYCQAQHLQILQKNSAMPHDAIKKSLAEKWTTMPHAQKNKYFAQFQEEQNVYENEMNDFLDNFQRNAENTCNSLIKQEPEEEEESIIDDQNRNGEGNVEHADNASLNSSSSLSEQGSLSSDDQDENG